MAHAHWHSLSADDRDPSVKQTKKRKRPFNATFSSWLQLFMARRRHRHNRYENGHQGLMHQSCYGGLAGPNGGPLRSSVSLCKFSVILSMKRAFSLAVVHETAALGSDGESIEVSPCTSDQSGNGDKSANLEESTEYVPKVKMRNKQNRRCTEVRLIKIMEFCIFYLQEDIQKRLSLPPDIKLPQNVIDKLNRTPTLENPLTRKSKRASLREIGFGRLETYKKVNPI